MPAAPETLPATLLATVLASRLRRGQWEAEVELDPAQLSGLAGLTERVGAAPVAGDDGDGGPARATALAQRPHSSGERVALRLELTSTVRVLKLQ